ncbi:proteinase-activated receptor 4-like [Engraulis encrasicolus]|uniref:proteinase-activated receptor 4-like n=1 Tax=Engraulis encrasicolus TaxID=184585 RepID=UPI002FD1630F
MAMAVHRSAPTLVLVLFLCTLPLTTSQSEPPCGATRARSFHLDNCSEVPPEEEKQLRSNTTTVLLPSLYLVALVVGLPSNLLALWVLLFRTKKQPSTILLINLTTCDLLLLVVLPFRIAYHFQGNNWTLGEPFCRLVMALFYGNMYGSIMCLALIAFDRYLALVHPFSGMMLRGFRLSVYMSVAVWSVVLAAMVPLLATRQAYLVRNLEIITCHDALPIDTQRSFFLPYFASLFSICFVLPLAVVVFCYCCVLYTLIKAGERYNHAAKVTVLVMVVCLVCLLPSNVLLITHNYNLLKEGKETVDNLYMPYMLMLALSTFNSCLDPFIFYYVSDEFREKALQVLCCRKSIKEPISSQKETSSTSMSSRSKVTLGTTSGQASAPTEASCLKSEVV